MLKNTLFTFIKVSLLFSFGVSTFSHASLAQIIPDNTLPSNSIVTPDNRTFVINGGTAVGENLFHSFKEFSIPTGNSSYFNNVSNIQNIFSRVTGSSVSSINGEIKANSTANVFLLNPNGIIFGSNASLNIGGSFLGTTAEDMEFADGSKFSATEPQATPLLTISVPIGLGLGLDPGEISVQGSGHQLKFANPIAPVNSPILGTGQSLTGLRTSFGKTLALVGGQVTINGGILTAPSGQIEIGSVAEGNVGLSVSSSRLSFNYDTGATFNSVHLDNRALIDASGISNGLISIKAQNLYLNNSSLVIISNFGAASSNQININTTDAVGLTGIITPSSLNLFSGEVSFGAIFSQNFFTGKGADINISARDLVIQKFSAITSANYGEGNGGNINVSVENALNILGTPPIAFNFLPSSISIFNGSSGNSGSIELSGKALSLQDGGLILSQTFGQGNGGNIITNFENIEILGSFPVSFTASLPVSSTFNSFIPSLLGAATVSSGRSGNVYINTRNLNIEDRGKISAETANSGAAGDIRIDAINSIRIQGVINNSIDNTLPDQSTISTSASRSNSFFLSLFSLPSLPEGKSGNIYINTNKLVIQNGGQISVINEGNENAGEINIGSPLILLDSKGSLLAATASGQGGDIKLQSRDLRLRNNSAVTTNAQGGFGRGGDITIDTDTLVALENSDITANAFGGPGGNVRINTQGIFGIEPRRELTSESDITASSRIGIDGDIEINTLDFDARNTLTPLTSSFVTTEQVVAGSCLARRNAQQGSFVVTGSGGLPTTPYSGITEWDSLTGVQAETRSNLSEARSQQQNFQLPAQDIEGYTTNWKPGDPIVEAQGIVKTADGRTLLGMKPEEVAIADTQALVCSAEASADS